MFFSAALQGDNDSITIAEDPMNGGGRGEAWEQVEVAEPGEVSHAAIVTGFAGPEKTKTAMKIRGFRRSGAESYPHESAKSLFSLPAAVQGLFEVVAETYHSP
jgi:hypothetical protein